MAQLSTVLVHQVCTPTKATSARQGRAPFNNSAPLRGGTPPPPDPPL